MSSAIGKRSAYVRVGSFSSSLTQNQNRLPADGNNGVVAPHKIVPYEPTPNSIARHNVEQNRPGVASVVDSPLSIQPACPGEHVIARQMLAEMLCGPSHAEFQAQQDDP